MTSLPMLYDQWILANTKLKKLKALELNLRKQICEPMLTEKLEGTVTSTNVPGYIVKATAKISRKVSNPEALAQLGHLMTAEEKSVYEWVYVPKINLENYRKHKTLFHVREQITEKPAVPALTIESVDAADGMSIPEQMDIVNQVMSPPARSQPIPQQTIPQQTIPQQAGTFVMSDSPLHEEVQRQRIHDDDMDDKADNFEW